MPSKTAKIITAPITILAIAVGYSLVSYINSGSKEPAAAVVITTLSWAISAGLYLLPVSAKQAGFTALFFAGSLVRIITITAGVVLAVKIYDLRIPPLLFWTGLIYITFLSTETYLCVRHLSEKQDFED